MQSHSSKHFPTVSGRINLKGISSLTDIVQLQHSCHLSGDSFVILDLFLVSSSAISYLDSVHIPSFFSSSVYLNRQATACKHVFFSQDLASRPDIFHFIISAKVYLLFCVNLWFVITNQVNEALKVSIQPGINFNQAYPERLVID